MKPAADLIAVIIDMSKSRSHPDRRSLQSDFDATFHRLNELVPATQQIASTVGDEFQAVYPDLDTALRATLLARLLLPEGVDCRFGLGRGEVLAVGDGALGAIQDGSAWWAARVAITTAWKHEHARLPFVRTWFDTEMSEHVGSIGLVNNLLMTRDHLVGSMSARTRRLLLGRLLGRSQAELALDEGISQSAVSQNLARSGATALLAGDALLGGVRTRAREVEA
jgi:hypothetical protein